jgi:hypothetical protein
MHSWTLLDVCKRPIPGGLDRVVWISVSKKKKIRKNT